MRKVAPHHRSLRQRLQHGVEHLGKHFECKTAMHSMEPQPIAERPGLLVRDSNRGIP